jgi:hypothetical protein
MGEEREASTSGLRTAWAREVARRVAPSTRAACTTLSPYAALMLHTRGVRNYNHGYSSYTAKGFTAYGVSKHEDSHQKNK